MGTKGGLDVDLYLNFLAFEDTDENKPIENKINPTICIISIRKKITEYKTGKLKREQKALNCIHELCVYIDAVSDSFLVDDSIN